MFASRQVPINQATELARLLEWCQARCGDPVTDITPAGAWRWDWIDVSTVQVTLPSTELVCEMSLTEPWRD